MVFWNSIYLSILNSTTFSSSEKIHENNFATLKLGKSTKLTDDNDLLITEVENVAGIAANVAAIYIRVSEDEQENGKKESVYLLHFLLQ